MATKIKTIFLFMILLCISFSQEKPQAIFKYGKASLTGLVVERIEYGAPNFENDGISKPVKVRFLKLPQPIEIKGDKEDKFNFDDIKDIDLIQIIEPHNKTIKYALGRTVIIKGNLEEAITAHHYTKAVLSVNNINNIKIIKIGP